MTDSQIRAKAFYELRVENVLVEAATLQVNLIDNTDGDGKAAFLEVAGAAFDTANARRNERLAVIALEGGEIVGAE